MFQWGRKTFMLVTGMLCSVSSCEVWGLAVPVAYTTAADLGSGHLTGIDEAVVEFLHDTDPACQPHTFLRSIHCHRRTLKLSFVGLMDPTWAQCWEPLMLSEPAY